MAFYAEVIVNNDSLQVDKPFTYLIPEKYEDKIKKGFRVKVPFGRGNKTIEGFVLNILFEYDGDLDKIKEISSLCDDEPILSLKDLYLIDFMRKEYLCKYIEAIRVIIPKGIMKGNKHRLKSAIFFKKELKEKFLKDNFKEIIEIIKNNNGIYTRAELKNKFNISTYSLKKLIDNEFLEVKEVIVDRANYREYTYYSKKILNEEQKVAVDTILNSKEKIFLLKGVTGSGKTEVYMNLVEEMLKKDKSTLILVPEISLTPQMIERFKGRFGKDVSVFHSKLSDGERFDEWFRVKSGRAKLVVGVRSAIFLPFNNLGLIVVDEEHESTYKSEQNPKYQTKEIAEFKSKLYGCKVVLGSATPSIESYYKAKTGNISLIELKNRVDCGKLPKIHIVDMREELSLGNKSIFSEKLQNYIEERLKNKEQIILFLNRRGYSTFVSCRSCGYVFKCDHCDIAMTYHNNGFLVCHYCGKTLKEPKLCPKCGSKYVKFFGTGTEKVEVTLRKLFPKIKILRMDVDTTRKKDSYEKIYNSFKKGDGDILVGTQMIAKGLDFKNVTLVGIIAADISLNFPDYRSSEKTFQIVTQVSGRAGRGDKEGEAVVQTYSPNHYSLKYAISNDYEGFYEEEIKIRRLMGYPPFKKFLAINLSSENEKKLIDFSMKLGNKLKPYILNWNLEMLGPCPAIIQRINGMYRWQILIKGNFDYIIGNNIKEILYENTKEVYNEIRVSIDINPNSLT